MTRPENITTDAAEMQTAEKRRYKRIFVRQPVQFQPKDSAVAAGSLSGDLSEGGVRIDTFEFLGVGTELTVQIRLAPEKMVECAGQVVWVRKFPFADRYAAGLEFAKEEVSRRQLHEFIGGESYVNQIK